MKNGIKKVISVLLVAVMVLGIAPLAGFVGLEMPGFNLFNPKAEAATYRGTCGNNLSWTLNTSTCVLSITGSGVMSDWFTVFSSTNVPPWLEYYSYIKTVNIGSGVTTIGDFAFYGCYFLQNVNISDTVNDIGSYAFGNCSIRNIVIPDSVTRIGDCVFSGCYALAEITLSDDLYIMGNSVFSGCRNLKSVTLPATLRYIGDGMFDSCDSLQSITVDENNKYFSSDSCGVFFNKNKTQLLLYPINNSRTSYTVPDGVKSIDAVAFAGNPYLTDVTLPDSLKTMGNAVFASCTSLKSIVIPEGMNAINTSIFRNCTKLTSVTIPEAVTSIGDSAFQNCNSLLDVYYGGTEAEWNLISIGNNNDPLFDADIYFLGHTHSYVSSVTEKATCTQEGVETFTCECGDSYVKSISKRGHNIVIDNAVASTCTSTGLTAGQHCSRCDDKTVEQTVVPELGHDIVIDEAVESTCTSTGLTAGQHCSRCNDATVEQEIIPATNHKNTLVQVGVQAPTCTKVGWDAYEYCTVCNYTTYAEKDALKHNVIVDEAIASTCTSTGLTAGQHCSRCDEMTVVQEIVPAKPHKLAEKYDSSMHWEECDCGSKFNVRNHAFVDGNVCDCGFRRIVDSTLKIKNNAESITINYGEILELTAIVTDQPSGANIYWYVDGVKSGEGETFNISFEGGAKIITVKLVDENGVAYEDSNGNGISDSEIVIVNSGFFRKIISFFKNLFGINRTIVQAFKLIY